MKRALLAAAAIVVLGAVPSHAGSQVTASRAALATPSPLTTQVGLNVLRNGGNAIDAAVAVAFALSVVQPNTGAIGGGGYLTYFDATTGAVWTLDFRETAPSGATPQMIIDSKKTRTGPACAGVPGTVAGLDSALRKFGSRPWKELLQPAIAAANEGVRVDDQLASRIGAAKSDRGIDQFTSTAALLYPNGKALAAGDRLQQTDLGATLTRLADTGARDFYEGEIAGRIVEQSHNSGGVISAKDLREYAPLWRAPLRFRIGQDEIYTVGPPSGGGMQLGIALNILAGFDLTSTGFGTPATVHVIAEAQRRAAIDAAKYVGDPSAARIPYRDLLSTERANGWRKSIRPDKVTATALLNEGGGPVGLSEHGTHFVIADASGNVVSVTMTVGDEFGSGFVVPTLGFVLNDALHAFTDPSLPPTNNSLAGGKRPADAMTSVMVLRSGKPYFVFGSGGDGINATNLQLLLDVILFDQPVGEAIAAARFDQRNQQDEIDYERQTVSQETVNALSAMGHPVVARESIGDVQALMFEGGKIIAIADPRHSGAAGGLN